MNFNELLKDNLIIEGLNKQGISIPTPVQIDSYRYINAGQNVIARSETGSGKTLAYLLPLFEQIDTSERAVSTLILVPTYELAIQVNKQIELLARNSSKNVRSAALIGNGNINRQIDQLKDKPHIIVGTAGRVHELIKKKKISAPTIKTLVIDEADKMLDKNNYEPMMQVRKCLYKKIQLLMYSASMNNKAVNMAKDIIKSCDNGEPVLIKYNDKETIPSNITHMYIISSRKEKIETLRSLCSAIKPNKCMIFVNTAYEANEAFNKLTYHNYKIESLMGSNDKIERKNAMERFKLGKANYLLSTDVASRGLHIDNVDTVINVTIPQDSKDYLHRCGRCGRNNQKGICISIITENELEHIKSFHKSFGINILAKRLYKGQLVKL